jgi:hypothetical protein
MQCIVVSSFYVNSFHTDESCVGSVLNEWIMESVAQKIETDFFFLKQLKKVRKIECGVSSRSLNN